MTAVAGTLPGAPMLGSFAELGAHIRAHRSPGVKGLTRDAATVDPASLCRAIGNVESVDEGAEQTGD